MTNQARNRSTTDSMAPHQSSSRHSPTYSDDGSDGVATNNGRAIGRVGGDGDGSVRKREGAVGRVGDTDTAECADEAVCVTRADDENDIYAQLDQFEHSLDAELQELQHEFNDTDERHDGIAKIEGGHSGESSSDDDSDSSGDRMTFMPPPSSWFHQLDDSYMDNAAAAAPAHKQKIESPRMQPTGGHNLKAGAAKTLQLEDVSTQSQGSDSHSISDDCVDMDRMPKYNSPEAQMFDFPVEATQAPTMKEGDDATQNPDHPPSLASTTLSSSLENFLRASSTTLSQTIPTLLHEYSTSILSKSVHKFRLEYSRTAKQYLRASDIGNLSVGYYKPPLFGHQVGPQTEEEARGCNSIAGSTAAVTTRDQHLDYMWAHTGDEVRFTTLPWVERQLVHEWRTYEWTTKEEDEQRLEHGLPASVDKSVSDDILAAVEMHHAAEQLTTDAIDLTDLKKPGSGAEDEEEEDDDPFDAAGDEFYERARTLAPRPLPRPEWEHASSCFACQKAFGATLHRHHCKIS